MKLLNNYNRLGEKFQAQGQGFEERSEFLYLTPHSHIVISRVTLRSSEQKHTKHNSSNPEVVEIPANIFDVDTPVKSHPTPSEEATKININHSSSWSFYELHT